MHQEASLRQRAAAAVRRPVPVAVRSGSIERVRTYRECAAVVGYFARTGRGMGDAVMALYELEALQGVVR